MKVIRFLRVGRGIPVCNYLKYVCRAQLALFFYFQSTCMVEMVSAESVREEGLDKFYTLPEIAAQCIAAIGKRYDWSTWDLIIEPSAGSGNFYTLIPSKKKIGIDIRPAHKSIVKQNFLTYEPPSKYKKILVVGNPPFSKNLAVDFFNHAAEFASVIAFIVPRTFRRVSIQNRLNLDFHLVKDIDIPLDPCAFVPKTNIKTCFQIWEKKDTPRKPVKLQTTHKDWEFLKVTRRQRKPPKGVDFAMRSETGECGEIVEDYDDIGDPTKWFWIKSNIGKKLLKKRFESLNYDISYDTLTTRNSLGRGDLVRLYTKKFG